ncbi:MAG: IPTL-CTERM sorting domain-containing protein [Xanthomonadales bacterium]|nr:IPTL-CTERM sorting domain-containing protein [Xanthomonadales bacterium]
MSCERAPIQSCTIYATAFFEGIPTLSLYGMVVMALLMLGVGFVGFLRFF